MWELIVLVLVIQTAVLLVFRRSWSRSLGPVTLCLLTARTDHSPTLSCAHFPFRLPKGIQRPESFNTFSHRKWLPTPVAIQAGYWRRWSHPADVNTLDWSVKYNQQDATFSRSIYFYKLLYMFHAVPPPIIRSTKLYIQRQVLSNQYCCYRGWDGTPWSSISSTIAADSSIGLTIPDSVCTVLCSWWWSEEPHEKCRAIYRNK